jgi:uncharacterized hydrophobic protein (TIGR00271 family)
MPEPTSNSFLERIRLEAIRLFSLPPDTHQEKAADAIKKSIEFKGVNLWALIFACLIASVGLNVGSTAVIIGAMLISPLMGPIVGIGFAVGTKDFDVIKYAFRNLLIMTLLSLVVAIIYFSLSPLKEPSTELIGRIRPTIYDVLIALSGGVIGTIAASRRDLTNVVPGVAIATALMPPICTAGYGIATLQFEYFIGAFYLFFINALFIALATTVVVRYMGFPKKEISDKKKEKRVQFFIGTLLVLGIIPSIFTAWVVVKEAIFVNNANRFITEKFNFERTSVLKPINAKFSLDSSQIEIFLIGQSLEEEQIDAIEGYLPHYGLHRTKLLVRQSDNFHSMDAYSQQLNPNVSKLLEGKDLYIRKLETEIEAMKSTAPKIYRKELNEVSRKLAAFYPEIKEVGFAETVRTRLENDVFISDTIPMAILKWKDFRKTADLDGRIQNALKIEFGVDSILVISY